MKGINARVEELKLNIVKCINDSQLPICMVDYVTTEIANKVKMDYIAAVQKENEVGEKMNKPVKLEKTKEVRGNQFDIIDGESEVKNA